MTPVVAAGEEVGRAAMWRKATVVARLERREQAHQSSNRCDCCGVVIIWLDDLNHGVAEPNNDSRAAAAEW